MSDGRTVPDILAERQKTHGSFAYNAVISQSIKQTLRLNGHWHTIDPSIREALDMIAHKMSRIVCGKSSYRDHWDDIAGYATLVSREIQKRGGDG